MIQRQDAPGVKATYEAVMRAPEPLVVLMSALPVNRVLDESAQNTRHACV